MTAEIAVGSRIYSGHQIQRANVSDKNDLTVNISDVVLLIERIMGGSSQFPADMP